MSVLRALWGRFGGIGGPLALQRLAFGKIGPQFGSEALAAITVISAWLGHSGAVMVVGKRLRVAGSLLPETAAHGHRFMARQELIVAAANRLAKAVGLCQFPPVAGERLGSMWPRVSQVITAFVKCCRSSVVEHSLGKGEAVSSILTGSTRFLYRQRA